MAELPDSFGVLVWFSGLSFFTPENNNSVSNVSSSTQVSLENGCVILSTFVCVQEYLIAALQTEVDQ